MINKSANENRRKELGKAMLDIVKYIATVVIVSGLLTHSLNVLEAGIAAGMAVALGIIAYNIIPAKMEKQED